VKLLSFFSPKNIKPEGLKVFLRHPAKIPSFVKKTGMPDGEMSASEPNHPGVLKGKLRLPEGS